MKKINSAQEILPILQHIATTGANLLIIADDIEIDVIETTGAQYQLPLGSQASYISSADDCSR